MKILCTTEASLNRPEVRRWRDRMGIIKPQGEVVIVLPCSMRKPYSQSKSHRIFMRATKNLSGGNFNFSFWYMSKGTGPDFILYNLMMFPQLRLVPGGNRSHG